MTENTGWYLPRPLAIVKLMSSLAGVKRETKAQSRNMTSYLMLTVRRSQAGAAGIGMQTGERKKRAPTSGSSVGIQEQATDVWPIRLHILILMLGPAHGTLLALHPGTSHLLHLLSKMLCVFTDGM